MSSRIILRRTFAWRVDHRVAPQETAIYSRWRIPCIYSFST